MQCFVLSNWFTTNRYGQLWVVQNICSSSQFSVEIIFTDVLYNLRYKYKMKAKGVKSYGWIYLCCFDSKTNLNLSSSIKTANTAMQVPKGVILVVALNFNKIITESWERFNTIRAKTVHKIVQLIGCYPY